MRGAVDHLGLTVSDLEASEAAFYGPVLGFLGYSKVDDTPEFQLWWHPEARVALNLWQATAAGRHDRRAPGFHHLAFRADGRDDVDRLHEFLVGRGVEILDAPAEYPQYAPGYYAVFFADPDGLKFELVHMPALPE